LFLPPHGQFHFFLLKTVIFFSGLTFCVEDGMGMIWYGEGNAAGTMVSDAIPVP